MRIVVQRVKKAKITINNSEEREIGQGLVVLLGIEDADDKADADWLLKKMLHLRIFDDENGIMNLSVLDVKGNLLIVSQFTLHASTKKGNRPSYIHAAKPEKAVPLYEYFIQQASHVIPQTKSGEFGAYMNIALENDGPVTIIIDSKNKE
jgi:D-tyrosyl-tRNA(Tyr) deacylase